MKRSVLNELLQAVYPDDIKCIVCGREIHPSRYGLCDDCAFTLNDNYCLRCGRHKVGVGDFCGECSKQTLYFDEARSSVNYDGNAKSIVWRLKYGSAKYLAKSISEYLLDTLMFTDWDFDCFTFVPMDKRREKKRGYNQAEVLAVELSDRTTSPCIPLLEKVKSTTNQARLDKQERMTNLSGAFKAVCEVPEHVVLVDDVMTTGATANECAKTLKNAGAKVVYVLTFASVPQIPHTDKQQINIKDFRK